MLLSVNKYNSLWYMLKGAFLYLVLFDLFPILA